jgi:Flp pilus assembly protein TadG
MTKEKFRLVSFLRTFSRNEGGSILIQFTITSVAIMGMIGLALDGGRVLMVHSDLQGLADAAALAAAAKLDGTGNAITNADAAARSAGSANNVRWSDQVSGTKVLSGTAGVQFYSSLNPDTVTTDPKAAGYVKVTTGSWQVAPSFLVGAGATSRDSTRASAVAKGLAAVNGSAHGGSGGGICVPQAMLLCNPSEPPSGGTGDASSFNPTRGQMFVFSLTGNTGGYSPGDFNLLDPATGNGASDVENFLSQQLAPACTGGGVSPDTGQKTGPMAIGLNVRFDQVPNGNTTGLDTTPAPIKVNGLSYSRNNGGQINCNPNQICDASTNSGNTACSTTAAVSVPLPLDPATTPGGSAGCNATGSSVICSGVRAVDLQAYWTSHHGGTSLPAGITTRYQAYQAEVAGTNGGGTWITTAETQGPVCTAGSGPEFTADRRVLHVAVVDCVYWGVSGNKVNDIPIGKYADFFITHAVPQSGANPSRVMNGYTSCSPPTQVTTTTPATSAPLCNNQVYTEFIQTHTLNDGGLSSGGGGGSGSASGINSIIQLVR